MPHAAEGGNGGPRSGLGLLRRWLPDPALPLDHQFFQGLCLLGGVISLAVVIPANQFQNLSPWVDRVVAAFGVFCLALAWAARRGRFLRKTLLLGLVACLDLAWFANGASQGSIGLYFFSAGLYLVLFFQGAYRIVSLGLLVANIIGLHLAERAWPGLVHPFLVPGDRLVDLTVGYLLSLAVCALMLWVVLEGFHRERAGQRRTLEALRASEARFSGIFEGHPDALLILDAEDGRVLQANAGVARMFGWPAADCVGRSLEELPFWSGDPDGTALVLRHRDGTELRAEATRAPLQLDGRETLLLTLRDATERHRAAQALAESERLYRELLERQGEGFGVVDDQECFIYANPLAEQIFGVEPGGLTGRRLTEFLEPEAILKVEAETRLRHQHLHSTYELDIRRPDGEARTVLVTATPGRLHPEEPLNVIGVFRDITEEKRAEQTRRLLEQEQHQAQKMESLGSLAGGVAHDFNNMLGGIMGYADLLLAGEQDARRREYLRAIVLAASRSADLTRKLLAFGRRGRNVVESLDPRALAEECLAMLRPAMGPDLKVSLHLDGCPRIDGDPAQLQQVLMNLCLNGIEAMPERGTLTVSWRIRDLAGADRSGLPLPPGRYLELAVADQGIGMTEEVRGRVFEPFFTTKHATGMTGTGLGLSTTYGIVRAHRGTVTVESARGRGSTFRVVLPVGTLPAPEAGAAAPALRGQGAVLLVEDEPLLRELGAAALESLGYEALTAADGVEAVSAFREHHGRLRAVLLDLKMPRMGGREAYLGMREVDGGVPVIVCTGYGDNEEVQELIGLGAAGMLAKPYRITELAARLGRAAEPDGL